MSIHKFQPDPDVADYCRCGLHRLNLEHGELDVQALPDLYKACREILAAESARGSDFSWKNYEKAARLAKAAIAKAEGRS